jgi:acyl-CoA reductase-like NAD-dependent aldehyde dehydrogenase
MGDDRAVDSSCESQGRAFRVPDRISGIVDGVASRSAGDTLVIPVVNPATEETVSLLIEDSPELVDQAVTSSHRAFREGAWPRLALAERISILKDIRRLLADHASELAYLDCIDTGVPEHEIRNRKLPRILENFDFAISLASMASGETYQQNPSYLTYVTRHPRGVCAIIAPWNSPMSLATMQLLPCIALGNTCVLKPSEHAPVALFRMVELMQEAGLPPGVVNLVNGRGPVTGSALVRDPRVTAIKFIGGTETGKEILRAAASGLKEVGLELGGKSANIIFEDADLNDAVDSALLGIYSNNGQQCLAGSRILVQRSVSDRFIGDFVDRARNIVVGDPHAGTTEMGPLAFREHYERVRAYVDVACGENATLLCGGQRPSHLDKGYFIAPTAVLATGNRTRVAQEEIFGPFATFLIFEDEDEALAIANDSRFGLVSYLWSSDVTRVMRVSQRLEAGTVLVNTPMVRELRAPFGGVRESGVGRDGARHTLDFFTEAKTTTMPLGKLKLRRLGTHGHVR